MKGKIRSGRVTQEEEFLFPDSELGTLPEKLRFVTPLNGKRGIQLLLPSAGGKAVCSFISEDFTAEWYEMKAVPWSIIQAMVWIRAEEWYLWSR